MKIISDFFALILFFVAYYFTDIYIATCVAIFASIVMIGYQLIKKQRPNFIQWASLAIIVLFGGATLIFHNPAFIKWKPTVLYTLMGVALLVAHFMFKKNTLKLMMGKELPLPDPVWSKLTVAWAFFFFFMAVLNIAIAYSWKEANWVNFKVFGGIGLTFLFAIMQSMYLARYLKEENSPATISSRHNVQDTLSSHE